jgi:hypothetical protein
LALEGRHYLPYRLHATPEQLHAGYPMASDFFAYKRAIDPQERLSNRFYLRYRGE